MIGNERVSPDVKFVELFQRVGRLELALAEALERIAELTEVLGKPPKTYDKLSLKSGTR